MTMRGVTRGKTCPDCGVDPGQLHVLGCDVERCPDCGHQMIGCGCEPDTEFAHPRLPWTGEWPGVAECREFGWYAVFTDDGWRRCGADTPGAIGDLTRLATTARWDADAGRFMRREGASA